MKVKYEASVYVQAGWRGVTITADVKKISEKRARVVKVLDVGGFGTTGSSKTSNRQRYFIPPIVKREKGKVKNLSSCKII